MVKFQLRSYERPRELTIWVKTAAAEQKDPSYFGTHSGEPARRGVARKTTATQISRGGLLARASARFLLPEDFYRATKFVTAKTRRPSGNRASASTHWAPR
jgi:hypothetical protein